MADLVPGTFYWQGYPGPAGYVDAPMAGLFPINVGVNPLALRDTAGYTFVLRAKLPDKTNPMVEAYSTIYPAASFGRSTDPDDVPPNMHIPGMVLGSTINYSIRLFNDIEPQANASGGQGAIVLVDPAGRLDYLIKDANGNDVSWDGAKLDILQGPPKDQVKNFNVVGRFTTAGILYDNRRKEIRLRDQADRLAKAKIHDQIYDGTGGLGGVTNLEGVSKPYGLGPNRNCEAVLIDPPRQIRQLSCSAIQSVTIGRDGGSPLTPTGIDYPNYAALAAAADASAIPAGQFSTCLAQGLVALGADPEKAVTFDFDGDASVINGVGYVNTLSGILRRIATGQGDIKLADGDIDHASLNDLSHVQPDISGYWWKEAVTKSEAFTRIMNGRLGWWAVRLNGLLSFGVMSNPIGSPSIILNYPKDFSAEPSHLQTYQVPRKGTYVGYQYNNLVQTSDQLNNAVVDAGDGLIYGQQTQYAHKDSTNPLWFWPTAQIVKVDGGFDAYDAAFTEATRQQDIMNVRRERWTVQVPISAFSDLLGKIVQINNYPRYGWGTTRKFICVGISFASGIAVTLELWG